MVLGLVSTQESPKLTFSPSGDGDSDVEDGNTTSGRKRVRFSEQSGDTLEDNCLVNEAGRLRTKKKRADYVVEKLASGEALDDDEDEGGLEEGGSGEDGEV